MRKFRVLQNVLPPTIVKLTDLRVSTRQNQEKPLLDIPDFSVYEGDRIIITGSSGNGKSLLLTVLSGTLSPSLELHGHVDSTYQRCGMIPQRGIEALHPLKKISRQLSQVSGKSSEKVAQTLEAVGLDPRQVGGRRPSELSGGQAQRVAIALAVLSEAQLILADEPTSALDHETRDQTLDLLLSVLSPQQALIITTHDPDVAHHFHGRRISVVQGRLVHHHQEEENHHATA